MKDHIKEKKENITIDDILSLVCKEFNIKPSDVKSNKKTQNIVTARRIVIYLARALTALTMPQLANYFEMKDHTAISKVCSIFWDFAFCFVFKCAKFKYFCSFFSFKGDE